MQGRVTVIHTVLMLTAAVSAVVVLGVIEIDALDVKGPFDDALDAKAELVAAVDVEDGPAIAGLVVIASFQVVDVIPAWVVSVKLTLKLFKIEVSDSTKVEVPLVTVRRVVNKLDVCWRQPILPCCGEGTARPWSSPPVIFTRAQDWVDWPSQLLPSS